MFNNPYPMGIGGTRRNPQPSTPIPLHQVLWVEVSVTISRPYIYIKKQFHHKHSTLYIWYNNSQPFYLYYAQHKQLFQFLSTACHSVVAAPRCSVFVTNLPSTNSTSNHIMCDRPHQGVIWRAGTRPYRNTKKGLYPVRHARRALEISIDA